MPFVLKALDCLSIGNAFTYLPLMIEANKEDVAIMFLNRSTERGARMIVPLLSFDVYICT